MKIDVRASEEMAALRQAEQTLAEANSLHEIQEVRNQAETLRQRLKKSRVGLKLQNLATAIKLRAERRLGKLIAELHLRGGHRTSNSHDESLTLLQLGIDHNESARLQQEAAVPDSLFQRYLRSGAEGLIELSSAGLLRPAKRLRTDARRVVEQCRTAAPSRGRRPRASTARNAATNSKNSRKSGAFDPSAIIALREAVEEVQNHRGQLEQLLKPVCKSDEVKLETGVRRQIVRLLADIASLLQDVLDGVKNLARAAGGNLQK